MLPAPQIEWTGSSGKKYVYHIYDLIKSFNIDRTANYIYARLNLYMDRSEWEPIFIGETENIKESLNLNAHPLADCIIDYGVTNILVHLSDFYKNTRIAEANDLIKNYQPICND